MSEGNTIKVPKEEDFTVKATTNQLGGVLEFKHTDDLDRLGAKLLEECPEFSHITDLEPRMCFAWKRRGGTSGGKRNFSNPIKCSPLLKYLGNYEFVVWVAADHTAHMAFDDHKIEAALFRALKRLQMNKQDDGDELCIVAHEFSGSIDEMMRYGAWFDDAKDFAERMTQLPMFEGKVFRRKKGSKEVTPLPFMNANGKNAKKDKGDDLAEEAPAAS